jgi:hypothetical protein
MIEEQQWKLEHSEKTRASSFLTYVGLCAIRIIVCILMYDF